MNLYEELADAFGREHPLALAQCVAGAKDEDLAAFLGCLSSQAAAALVAHSVPLAVAGALGLVSPEHAKNILCELDPWSVAAVMGRVDSATRTRLLSQLPPRISEPVRRLLTYSSDKIGSRMDPRAPSVLETSTVAEAVAAVQREPAGALYYVYVIGEHQVLTGVMNMRELMSERPARPVRDVMTKHPQSLRADDPLDVVAVHPAWQRVHALPVVDKDGRFVGVVRYSAFRRLEAELGQSLAAPDPSRTAAALAELFWLGASAVVRTAETALLGPASIRTRTGS